MFAHIWLYTERASYRLDFRRAEIDLHLGKGRSALGRYCGNWSHRTCDFLEAAPTSTAAPSPRGVLALQAGRGRPAEGGGRERAAAIRAAALRRGGVSGGGPKACCHLGL